MRGIERLRTVFSWGVSGSFAEMEGRSRFYFGYGRREEQHERGRLQCILLLRQTIMRTNFLTAVAVVASLSALPIFGQTRTPSQGGSSGLPKFEVASVRLMADRDKLPQAQQMYSMTPSGAALFTVRNVTLTNLIYFAFNLGNINQITEKPTWFDSTYYEISARPGGDAGHSYAELQPLLQQLLQERFHLSYHLETKSFKGYALVVAKRGARLTPTNGAAPHAYLMRTRFDASNEPLKTIAWMLSRTLGERVVDQTKLQGNYDIKLSFAPIDGTDSSLPSIFTALDEQLGLKLLREKVPVEMFVVDHVDREPTEN